MRGSSLLERTDDNERQRQPDDILDGYNLRGVYGQLQVWLGLLVFTFVCYGWLVHTAIVLDWLRAWSLEDISKDYTGVVPFIWADDRLGFKRILMILAAGTGLSALLSTLQNRRISETHFGLALGALLFGSFAYETLVIGKVSSFALINAIVVFAGAVASIIYLLRFVRGLFVMRYGIGNWFIRIFKNLFMIGASTLCVAGFYYSEACIVMLIGGWLSGIILLVLKPVENPA